MKKILSSLLLGCLSFTSLFAAEQELRGAWIAWAGTNVPSRALIAESMEALADAHFNIVYVDVWRYGYPYFRSSVFKAYTGLETDPSVETNIAPERDVLAEMIVEAHRVGLEVDAWFEAGFNAGYSVSSPIYQYNPHWLAKTKSGAIASYGQAGPSCIHVLPEVQEFLIELSKEVIQNYDIDGIEFDRIRYPSLDCGYDTYTKELYRSETGSYPPTSTSNSAWIRWRADKLTEFVGAMHDTIKSLNPNITISNAPLPWGYEQFCQDYAPWIDNGYLDIVTPQMYMNSNTDYTWRMNNELNKIQNDSLMYPGISTVANGNYTSPSELVAQINTTRNKPLKGNVIWYHAELMYNANNYLPYLKAQVYQEKAHIPYRPEGWRPEALIIDIDSSSVTKTGTWEKYSGSNVYDYYNKSFCYIADANTLSSADVSASISESGWYRVYAFQNIPKSMASASDISRFTVHSDLGDSLVLVNQKTAGNAGRWEDLGTYYFNAASSKNVLSISTPGSGSGYTFIDAIMLIRSRNPFHGKKYFYTNIKNDNVLPASHLLDQNFPNPFNPSTHISYHINEDAHIMISIFDIQGKKVADYDQGFQVKGTYQINIHAHDLASGVYLYALSIDNKLSHIKKMTVVK